MINNLVYSGMIVPGIIFTGLFLVPWIERQLHRRTTASTTSSTDPATRPIARPPAPPR